MFALIYMSTKPEITKLIDDVHFNVVYLIKCPIPSIFQWKVPFDAVEVDGVAVVDVDFC